MDQKKYVFDKDSFKFTHEKGRNRRILLGALLFIAVSIALTVIYYVVFALFFSTETERSLKNENRMIGKVYPEMQKKAELLSDVVGGLKARDQAIYEEIFEAEAPDIDQLFTLDLLPVADSLEEENLVKLTEAKADILMKSARNVEDNMRRIFEICSSPSFILPPMELPLEDFSLPMTGASVGKKINPFYKVPGQHDGIDLMASLGEKVLAPADGTVIETVRSRRGSGNQVVLQHEGGFRTRYTHLSEIKVNRGRRVRKGDVIGSVGMTGSSFAPHLHYEVWRDTLVQNPVNYFFGSVDPYEYVNMLIVSTATGQSLD